MSNLYAFLHPELPEQKEVVFPRFKDEEGNVVPFLIKPITGEENKTLINACTKKDASGKRSVDFTKYQVKLVVAGTVRPDFSDTELCEAYGTLDPEITVGRMLLAGEYAKLSDEILKLSGLGDEAEEEAKN